MTGIVSAIVSALKFLRDPVDRRRRRHRKRQLQVADSLDAVGDCLAKLGSSFVRHENPQSYCVELDRYFWRLRDLLNGAGLTEAEIAALQDAELSAISGRREMVAGLRAEDLNQFGISDVVNSVEHSISSWARTDRQRDFFDTLTDFEKGLYQGNAPDDLAEYYDELQRFERAAGEFRAMATIVRGRDVL
jgi:hypothetical protein